MTSTQAVRAPQRRRSETRPLRQAHRQARSSREKHRTASARELRAGSSWEVRSFVGVSLAIAAAFVLVLLYLSLATAVSAAGYEAQRLVAERAELRRQNALLEIESARLASPARVEAEAATLGLQRAAQIKVVAAEAVAAAR